MKLSAILHTDRDLLYLTKVLEWNFLLRKEEI